MPTDHSPSTRANAFAPTALSLTPLNLICIVGRSYRLGSTSVFTDSKKVRTCVAILTKNEKRWYEKPNVKDSASIAIMAALIAFIYRHVLDGSQSLITNSSLGPKGPLFIGDPAAGGEITAYKQYAVTHAWMHLHLPIWLPTEGYGISLDSNQAAPWFFPESILHVLFPTNLSVWNVLALFLGSLGAYLLARDLKINRPGSIAASLAYTLVGPAVSNLNLDMINPLIVLPFALFSSKRFVEAVAQRQSAMKWFLIFAFVMSQLFLSGFAEVLPLEALLIGIFTIARIITLRQKPKIAIRIVLFWSLAILIALLGSLIALVPLWETLKTYSLFQPPGSSLAHEPNYFLIDVFDSWVFGKGIAGDPLELGNTIWVPGNPVIYAIAVGAVINLAIFWKRIDVWIKTWITVFTVFTVIGLLGFSNLLGILNIFKFPPFDLIYTPRFLPFMWWLPFVLLVGYGVDIATKANKVVVLSGYVALAAFTALLVANLFQKGPSVFAILNSQNLDATIVRNTPVLLLFIGALGATLSTPKKHRSRIAALFVAITIFVMLPKNFFSWYNAPQQARPLANFLIRNDLSKGLTFSPYDYVLPSGILGNSIPSIQAFDVFFPPGYTVTIEHWFGTEDPFSVQSPLNPGAPALENVALNYSSLNALVRIGVETLIVHSPITVSSISKIKILPEPPGMGNISSEKYKAAMAALLNTYLSRPDLQTAFTQSEINSMLFKWALGTPQAGDGASVTLSPYFPIYARYLSLSATQPSSAAFAASSTLPSNSLVGLRFIGKTFFGPTPEYVYDIGKGANKFPFWVPKTLHFYKKLNPNHPIALNKEFAAVPYNFAGSTSNQKSLSARLISLQENESSLTATIVANHGGLAVIGGQAAPGERLFINGKREPITLVNGFLTAISLHRGSDHVVIEFASTQILGIFALSTSVNVLLLILLGVVTIKPKYFRRPQTAP